MSSDALCYQNAFPARISVAESEVFVSQASPGVADVYNTYCALLQRSDKENTSMMVPIDYCWLYGAIDRAP